MASGFEKIGTLVFDIIDDFEARKRSEGRKSENHDRHYIEVLVREPWVPFTLRRRLREELMFHNLVGESVSEHTVNAELRDIVLDPVRCERLKGLPAEAVGREMVGSLIRKRYPRLVVFPISGFLPSRDIAIVGTAVIGTYKNILEHFSVQSEHVPSDDEPHAREKRHLIQVMRKEEEEYQDVYCAGALVRAADHQSAAVLAAKEIELSLHLVRLLLPLEYGLERRPRISIYELPDPRRIFVISVENARRDLATLPLSLHYPIIESTIDRYEAGAAVTKASGILRKDPQSRTALENRLVEALKWAGEAIDTTEKTIKVVKSVIALELLFVLPDERKQSQFVQCVTAVFDGFAVSKTLIDKWAKHTYSLRSAIVHRGKTAVTDEEAEWAERIACGCILRVLEKTDDFTTDKEFQNWLETEGE